MICLITKKELKHSKTIPYPLFQREWYIFPMQECQKIKLTKFSEQILIQNKLKKSPFPLPTGKEIHIAVIPWYNPPSTSRL